VLNGVLTNEYTGIGCHTGMWDFKKNDFHEWMFKEDFTKLFSPIIHNSTFFPLKEDNNCKTGIGIHDSSAALIPYMKKIAGPFLLLSTGTWSICLNPFNDESLTATDLANDCLCYLRPDGKQVKASRYLLGKEFSKWEQMIANVFEKSENYHHKLKFDLSLYNKASSITSSVFTSGRNDQSISFTKQTEPNLESFDNYEEAYHQLVFELAVIQREKIYLSLGKTTVNEIFIDGGFTKNEVFVKTLEHLLPQFTFIPSDIPLGSSLGAAMIVREKVVNNISP
jgi:sugar (pentulose or hexulose) kinase